MFFYVQLSDVTLNHFKCLAIKIAL